MLGKDHCLSLIEAALAACEGDQAEVILQWEESALTRVAESVIHQNVAETNASLSVRAVLGKRIAAAKTNQLTAESAREVARRARELAAVAAEDKDFRSLPKPERLPELPSYAAATAESTPEARAAAMSEVVAVATRANCRASGSLSVETAEIAVGNSLGVRAYAPATQAAFVTVIADDDSSGYADWFGTDLSRFDPRAAAEIATQKCVAGRGAKPVDPGVYTVILEPPAVGEVLGLLSWNGFDAYAFQEGRSFLSGRLGEKVMGENITIWDDGTDPRGLPIAFDWEGLPKRKVMLIESGVGVGVAYDTYAAGKEGKATTGNALPAPTIHGPMPTNLFLGLGDATLEDMIAATDRGLLVTRFHYTNIIHPKLTTFTGMTRDGTFLIEGGKIVRPVQKLRFTESILTALSAVEMIGREGRLVEGGYVFAPAIKVGRFSFTS